MSLDRTDRCGALIDTLRGLDYCVDVKPPFFQPPGQPTAPRIAYLGPRAWPDKQLQCALKSNLLALEHAAFDWAGPAVSCVPEFLTWPCSPRELDSRLKRGGLATSRDPLAADRAAMCDRAEGFGLIGRSTAFADTLVKLKQFARSDAAVLIHGETGTGKELSARALHGFGAKSAGPFVAINCGALPDTLIESELFGHEKGAFTDAKSTQTGLVAQASGGTLFLDEIEALSPKGQVALLRFLESFEYRRVGGSKTLHADLRAVSASNEDLNALARRGVFRRDLVYRLNILDVTLPPLRNRPGDAELLAEHFVARYAEKYGEVPAPIAPASRAWLEQQDWPGNVRELENTVHRAIVTSGDDHLSFGSMDVEEGETEFTPFSDAKQAAIDQFERRYLSALLRETGGNVTQAAARANKERRAFGKLLRKHRISSTAFRPLA